MPTFTRLVKDPRSLRLSIKREYVLTKLASPSITDLRLQHHEARLASEDITALSGLGKLSLAGNIVPEGGITRPLPEFLGRETIFQSAFALDGPGALARIGDTASLLRVDVTPVSRMPPLPSTVDMAARSFLSIPLHTAYWAASWIELLDNTTSF